MSNPEKSTQYGDYPPPPPGPPPSQQHDQHAPPQYHEQSTLPPQYEHQQPYAQQYDQQQHHEPPPPLPNPLNAHPVHVEQTVPQYSPAAPTFAPPPTGETYSAGSQAQTSAAINPTVPPTAEEQALGQKKPGWGERFSNLGIKAAAPINSLAHKLGSQSFLPETLDKECDKAAAILKAFCKKGVYADPGAGQPPTSIDPKASETNDGIIDPTKEKPKNRVIVTIPPKVISKAVGLAIFTTLRAGFHVTGATGSGILIARLPDGSWGPPSGIQVHSVGGGFTIGLDIYDCVCVINSKDALEAFKSSRVSMGSDLAVVAGPYGAGGAVDFGAPVGKDEKDKNTTKQGEAQTADTTAAPESNQKLKPTKPEKGRRSPSASALKPVFSYVKSRGFYAGVQVDGTVIVERKDANTAFYGEKLPVDRILRGEVPAQGPAGMWPGGARVLFETLRGAEAGLLQQQGKSERTTSGIPPPGAVPAYAPATGAAYPTSTAGPAAYGTEGARPVAPGGLEQPPAYVDAGVQQPGTGDYKHQYQ